jgi:hypothetical protein
MPFRRRLFRYVLTNSYFTFNAKFYGQTGGVTRGSSLFHVTRNFYMEDYEREALESAPVELHCWFRYVATPSSSGRTVRRN